MMSDVYKDPTNLFFQMAMIECETVIANLTGPNSTMGERIVSFAGCRVIVADQGCR